MRLSLGMMAATLATMIAAPAPVARAGGESSTGGADDFRIVPAFFLGREGALEPVTACSKIAPDFGVSEATLVGMVKRSFQQWGDYLERKRLNDVDGWQVIRTKLDYRPKCLGDENLVFYFGVEDELVAKYKREYAKPFGFAQSVQEGDTYPSGRKAIGIVWIAPNGSIDAKLGVPQWSPATADALEGLVLHEVGHVFGNGHLDGTVMTEKIGQYLEKDSLPAQSNRNVALYFKIDSKIEMYLCVECKASYRAAETFDPLLPPGQSSDWALTFKLLTGREPVAPLAIRYERTGSLPGSGKLTLMDSIETLVFSVDVESEMNSHWDSAPLFVGHGRKTSYSLAISYYGRIRTSQGQELHVAVNYNMDGKKAEIRPLGGGDFYPRPIFVAAD